MHSAGSRTYTRSLYIFLSLSPALWAEQAKLAENTGASIFSPTEPEPASKSEWATEWDTLRKVVVSRTRELVLELRAFVDKTPRKQLLGKGLVAVGCVLCVLAVINAMLPSAASHVSSRGSLPLSLCRGHTAGGEQPERRHRTGRERTGSPTLQALQDPILLLPCAVFVAVGFGFSVAQTETACETVMAKPLRVDV